MDYNGHMNDAAYAKVFSQAVDAYIDYIGLHEEVREKLSYTIFTLETHICYLQEVSEGEKIIVTAQLIDADSKRLHLFFDMTNEKGECVATSEQMLMGMDMASGKPAKFPQSVTVHIERIRQQDSELESPKQLGRKIGIRR